MREKTVAELVQEGQVDHVDAAWTVLDALRTMAEVRRGAVPVIEAGRLVGMFSERDLMLRVVLAGRDPATVRVRDVMTRKLVVAHPDDTTRSCLALMRKMHFRHLPVVHDDRLVGLVSLRDLMEVDRDVKAQEIEMLNYYVGYPPEQDRP